MSLKIDTGALSHLAAIHGYQKNCLSSGKISSAHIWTDNLCAKDDKKKDIFIWLMTFQEMHTIYNYICDTQALLCVGFIQDVNDDGSPPF